MGHSMKKQTTRSPRIHSTKKLLLGSSLCVVTIVIVLGALQLTGTTHLFGEKHFTAGEEQKADSDAAAKKQLIEESQKDGSNTPPSDYTPPSDPSNIKLSATESGGTVTVTSQLYHYSDGTCSLTLTNGSRTANRTADVIYQPEFSTCAGFSVPTSTLGSGSWNVRLTVTSGSISKSQNTTVDVP